MENAVNERVKIVFADSKLNKAGFAKRSGLQPSSIDNILTGRSTPSTRTIRDIALAFGVNENWLLFGEGSPYVKGTILVGNPTSTTESELVHTLREQIQFLQEDLKVWRQTAHNLSAALGKDNPLGLLGAEGIIIPLVLPRVGAA